MVIRAPRTADYYFTVPIFQFRALKDSYELVEQGMPALIRKRGFPQWDGDPATSGEAVKAQFHQHMIDSLIPQVYRGAFLVALWGLYESAVIIVGTSIRRLDPTIAPVPSGSNWLSEVQRHFKSEIGFSLFPPSVPKVENQLRTFQKIRNVFMHGNGMKEAAKRSDWHLLEEYARKNPAVNLENNYLEVSADFVRGCFELMAAALKHVTDMGRDKLEELGVSLGALPEEPPPPPIRFRWLRRLRNLLRSSLT